MGAGSTAREAAQVLRDGDGLAVAKACTCAHAHSEETEGGLEAAMGDIKMQ